MERVIGRNNNTEAEQKYGVYRVASFDAGFVCDDADGQVLTTYVKEHLSRPRLLTSTSRDKTSSSPPLNLSSVYSIPNGSFLFLAVIYRPYEYESGNAPWKLFSKCPFKGVPGITPWLFFFPKNKDFIAAPVDKTCFRETVGNKK